MESGGPSPVMDQLGFVIMALIVAFPIVQPEPQYVAVLVIVTLCIHWLSSALGYLMGFKSHPW
jgi:CDP-2,3-bis-(O-geranylgeranyl)-sn-glycerol synthase